MIRPMTIGAILGVALAVGLVLVLQKTQPPSGASVPDVSDAGTSAPPRQMLPRIQREHPFKDLPIPPGSLEGLVPNRVDPAVLMGAPAASDGGAP